jgi:hypothetical protein
MEYVFIFVRADIKAEGGFFGPKFRKQHHETVVKEATTCGRARQYPTVYSSNYIP